MIASGCPGQIPCVDSPSTTQAPSKQLTWTLWSTASRGSPRPGVAPDNCHHEGALYSLAKVPAVQLGVTLLNMTILELLLSMEGEGWTPQLLRGDAVEVPPYKIGDAKIWYHGGQNDCQLGLLFRPPFRQKITGTLQKTPEFRKNSVMISRSETILAFFLLHER